MVDIREGSKRLRLKSVNGRPALWETVVGNRARHFALIAFIAIVFLTGGASRHDVMSLIILRPLAFVFIAYAIVAAPAVPRTRPPRPFALFLIGGLALLALVQLVPLPPSIWEGLPQHEVVARIEREVGLNNQWRPLSLSVARTWNSLFSLAVPLAIIMLYRIAPTRTRKMVLPLLIGGAVLSIVIGIFQLVGGERSLFQLYQVHTKYRPIGLFANRNHQGVFLGCTIILAAVYAGRLQRTSPQFLLKLVLSGGLIAVMVPFVLVLGSRAGALISILALPVALLIILRSPLLRERVSGRGKAIVGLPPGRLASIVAAVFGLSVAGLAYLTIANSRDESLSRLAASGESAAFDRDQVFPYLMRMIADVFPWGTGYGSFDAVFNQYEPRVALSTTYLNHAHNDWLQIGIEGGLPGLFLLAAALMWWSLSAIGAWRGRNAPGGWARLGIITIIALIGLASAVDYPLRVPIFMMFAALLSCLLVDRPALEPEKKAGQTRPRG